MMSLLLTIACITGGILLGLATLDKLDGEANFFNKIAGYLVPFQTVIGGALIFFGIWNFWGNLLYTAVELIGGLLLITHVIKVESIKKISAKLMPFKAIVGIALLVVGILRLF